MNSMKIGFIGAGAIARAIGFQLVSVGHDVVLSNSRGPETITSIRKSVGWRAGTIAEAADRGVVFLAVNWSKIPAAVRAAGDLTGRILVDTNNPLRRCPPRG